MGTAVLFPGQGSQSIGMLSAYKNHPVLRGCVDEVSSALSVDFAEIIEGDESALNDSINTQPIMLAMGVGVFRMLADTVKPQLLAGHSLGEYSALVNAQVLSLSDAARLVRARAELMQSAAADGGMAAVLGLSAEQVDSVCQQAQDEGAMIWGANYNTATQVVVAGVKSVLEQYVDVFKEKGAKRVVVLAMNVPSHCPLLAPAAEGLKRVMETMEFSEPAIPVLHSAAADVSDGDYKTRLIETMSAQLVRPIDWTALLAQMKQSGIEAAIEAGAGRVLTGFGKTSGIRHTAVHDAESFAAAAGQG